MHARCESASIADLISLVLTAGVITLHVLLDAFEKIARFNPGLTALVVQFLLGLEPRKHPQRLNSDRSCLLYAARFSCKTLPCVQRGLWRCCGVDWWCEGEWKQHVHTGAGSGRSQIVEFCVTQLALFPCTVCTAAAGCAFCRTVRPGCRSCYPTAAAASAAPRASNGSSAQLPETAQRDALFLHLPSSTTRAIT